MFSNTLSAKNLKKAIAAIFLTTIIAPLLAFGPLFQEYVLKILDSDAVSIYKSIYGQGIVEFGPASDYFAYGFGLPYIAFSLLISSASLLKIEIRSIIFRIALITFLVLFLYDLINGILARSISLAFLLENFVFDLLGALLLSLVICSILSITDFLFLNLPTHRFIKYVISYGFLLLSAFIVPFTLYLACSFVLNPRSTSIYFALKNDASGYYFAENKHDDTGGDTTSSVMPPILDNAKASWISSRSTNLNLGFNPVEPGTNLDVETEIETNCSDENGKIKHIRKKRHYKNLEKFSASASHGVTQLNVNTDHSASGKYKVSISSAPFWFANNSEEKSYKITEFVTEKNSGFDFLTSSKEVISELILFTFKNTNGSTSPTKRTIEITTDKGTEIHEFSKPNLAKVDGKIIAKCGADTISKSSNITKWTNGSQIKAKFDVFPHRNHEYFKPRSIRLSASGGLGWLSISGEDFKELENADPIGPFKAILITSGVDYLRVGEKEIDLKLIDKVATIDGNLKGRFSKGKLIFTGSSKYIWNGSNRVSPTRWELLDWPIKLFLISLISMLLAPLFQISRKAIRKNTALSWV